MARRPPRREAPPAERVQKLLASAGHGSRRQIEGWIEQGRLSLNGRPAQLGDRASGRDRITLDGKPLRIRPRSSQPRVLIYHKPVGEICSRRDAEGRRTVFEALPPARGGRWVAIGRLDLNTSGLLLFTDDGALANRLAHPSNGFQREYRVRIAGQVDDDTMQRLRDGITLDDGPARFEGFERVGGEGVNQWYSAVLGEGRNRLVRRMIESEGLQVSRLLRIRFGPVVLPRWLHRGQWAEASPQVLQDLTGGPAPPVAPTTRRRPPPRRR